MQYAVHEYAWNQSVWIHIKFVLDVYLSNMCFLFRLYLNTTYICLNTRQTNLYVYMSNIPHFSNVKVVLNAYISSMYSFKYALHQSVSIQIQFSLRLHITFVLNVYMCNMYFVFICVCSRSIYLYVYMSNFLHVCTSKLYWMYTYQIHMYPNTLQNNLYVYMSCFPYVYVSNLHSMYTCQIRICLNMLRINLINLEHIRIFI